MALKQSFLTVAAMVAILWNTNRATTAAPICSPCDEESQQVLNEIEFTLSGPHDCTDISGSGETANGIYKISSSGKIFDVYCDLTTPGGGWLVFQRRKDGKVDFFRDWTSYRKGFGDKKEEFWLGNELLHTLTKSRKYKLRIDLQDFAGAKRYAEYSTFYIGSSATNYKLTVGGYKGDAGDSLSGHNHMPFTTKDADHDLNSGSNCAVSYKGAWWYKSCHHSNLNGAYLHGPHESFANGVDWLHWKGYNYSLKVTEMKIALAD